MTQTAPGVKVLSAFMASHMQDKISDIGISETHIIPDEDDNDDHSFQEQQEQVEYQPVVQVLSQTTKVSGENIFQEQKPNATTVSRFFDSYSYSR